MSLHAKLAEVMAEVGRIPKNGYNDFHKYKYVLESDLVEAVRSKLAERQVMLYPSAEEISREGTLTTVRVKFTAADGESGETFDFWGAGCGDDKSDKGVYKALTGALKYGLMKLFLVPTGDDPEADTKESTTSDARGKAASGSGSRAGTSRPAAAGGGQVAGEAAAPPVVPDIKAWLDAALQKKYGDSIQAKRQHMEGVFRLYEVENYLDLSIEQVEEVCRGLEA